MGDVKIQINSLAALERLLGNEPEMAIEVRNAVVQSFAKNFAKHLANSEQVAAVLSSMEKDVMNEIHRITMSQIAVIAPQHFRDDWRLSPNQREKIAAVINDAIKELVNQCIVETLTPETVQRLIDHRISQMVKPAVDRAIETAVQGKIKEILNS